VTHFRAFLPILLLAVLLNGLIPAGFMPGGREGTPVVICHGIGTAVIYLDKDGRPAAPDKAAAHSKCPFAPVLAQGMPVPSTILPAASDYGSAVVFAVAESLTARAVFKPWFSQGPPSLRA
jgi:hypothetical protein